ncbi:MAG: zinc-dependent peptidase [bacterium]
MGPHPGGGDYAELVRDAEAGRSSCLDQYGATNPTEFFAVATESYFENPVMLRDRHPRLYAVLMAVRMKAPLITRNVHCPAVRLHDPLKSARNVRERWAYLQYERQESVMGKEAIPWLCDEGPFRFMGRAWIVSV